MAQYLAGAIATLLLLAACGDPNDAGGSAVGTDPPPSELQYGCGGGGTFTPRDIEEGPEPSQDILDALHELPQTMDGAMLPEDGWKVVAEEGRATTLLAASDGEIAFASATFERQGNDWKPARWGDCTPRLVVEDKSVLRWAFDSSSFPPDPEATQLTVLASDSQCSSGRDLEGLIEPEVTYGKSRIEVVLTAPSLETGKNSAYTCIGTAPTEYTLELDEPVGEREVVDPSVYPAVEPGPGTRLP